MPQVLIVDDYAPNLSIFARVVRQLGDCDPVCFESSAEALTWAEGRDPALAVVDFNMPAPNGAEFVRRLRALRGHAETPVIVVTGHQEREIRREALASGASAFLGKPVDPLEFLSYARQLLDARRNRIELLAKNEALTATVQSLKAERQSGAGDLPAAESETRECLWRVIKARSEMLAHHAQRSAVYAQALAETVPLPTRELVFLGPATELHDIGMTAVPDRITGKLGRLDQRERAIVNAHCEAGFEVLAGSKSPLLQLAARIALSHHENFDGSGYPRGQRAEEIPLAARIVAVSDAFAALTSNRPQRPALSIDATVAEIRRGRGIRYDPLIVDALTADIAKIRTLAATGGAP